jgi:hypothetical protein
MTNLVRSAALSLLVIAASMAHGGIPAMKVTVSDATGKAAFTGATNSDGLFATANLKPGNYVVQFNANSAAVKGKQYALVVSAGRKKVVASAVPGEKFTGGGVAMRVEVGAGLNITGQVAADADVIVRNGKTMVWIPPMLGSNMPGHWAERGSAEEISSRTRGIVPLKNIQRIHDNAGTL